MKNVFLAIIISWVTILACNNPVEKTALPFPSGKWIDLTHSFDENTIYWPTAQSFLMDTVFAGTTEGGYYYSAFQFLEIMLFIIANSMVLCARFTTGASIIFVPSETTPKPFLSALSKAKTIF